MMGKTKPDCICAIEELADRTILPEGWVMIYRNWDGCEDGVGIKYLGGIDPLEHIEALERERDALHAALTVFEATWDTGGLLDPYDFWEKCWPAVNRLVPPEHQLLTWAIAQQERERAALATKEKS